MISVSQCAAQAGLASNELVLGAIPSYEHDMLLESYMLNAHRGLCAVRAMIVADLRAFLDLGVASRAADLLIVLRLLLTAHPEAALEEADLAEARFAEAGLAASAQAGARDAAFDTALLRHYLDARRLRVASAGGARGPGVVLSFSREARRTDRRAALGESPDVTCGDAAVARLGSRLSLRNDR